MKLSHLHKPILGLTVALSVFLISTTAFPERLQPIEPSINPELAEHTNIFAKKIYKIGSNVYSAVGWGLANTIMVEGNDGVIIVDTGEDIDSARVVYAELKKISDKPVKAIIYTHFHPDHINGVKAYTSEEEVNSGGVAIIAHSSLLDNVINQGDKIGPILGMRTGYTSGFFLDPEENEGMNLGIGPRPNVGKATFIAPTLTYEKEKNITIAGVELELRHVPSEAPDETAVYLPKENILLSGETIQGPTLPNIHTLRGTKFRDPVQWYKSIDVLRSYQAGFLVPAHGQPVYGKDEVEKVLRVTRDGIQYIHDQTIRHMNKGLTPDELVEVIKLPPYLAEQKPYLREYYGTVKHATRQIYQGYLGWFRGDPVELDPTPPVEFSRRHIELMGGRDAVLEHARSAYDASDYQWAAELTTYLIRVDHIDEDARKLKAACFRQLGFAQINTNWRNWYLTSAHELDGSLDVAAVQRRIRAAMSSPDLLAALPVEKIVEGLSVRLKAEQTLDLHILVAFELMDKNERFGMEIRQGVAQFHSEDLENADVRIRITSPGLFQLLSGRMTIEQAKQSGEIITSGNESALIRFLESFEGPEPINLTIR